MKTLLAIDPGTEQSGFVVMDGFKVVDKGVVSNDALLSRCRLSAAIDLLVIEKVESFGMAVGETTFETVFWTGRFAEAFGIENTYRIGRKEVKMHLCGKTVGVGDSAIRQRLIDMYGPEKSVAIGRKATPGPLYGVTKHAMQALAVAVVCRETRLGETFSGQRRAAACGDPGTSA